MYNEDNAAKRILVIYFDETGMKRVNDFVRISRPGMSHYIF